MTTTTHKRSIHIDAPVEKVFEHVKDPRHFYEAFASMSPQDPPRITDITMTPEGVGSTYEWTSHLWSLLYIGGTMTREDYVPNERIVDHSSTGVDWTFTFEPDQAGTRLSLASDVSSRVPLADKIIDAVAWNGDRDLDAILGSLKKAIET
jgi:hypothetical protein